MNPKVANVVLGLFLLQTIAIGLLPVFLGYSGLKICSIGSISYGLYAFVFPHRMVVRLQPQGCKSNSPAEFCVKDVIRVWALFCTALGAMGLVIATTDDEQASTNQQFYANCVFFAVAIISILWDYHLMISIHWGAENFLLVNIAANTAICIASGTGVFQLQQQQQQAT